MSRTNRPSSRAYARELVDSIAMSHGRPRQEVWDRVSGSLSEADLQELESAFNRKDRLIGSSVMT